MFATLKKINGQAVLLEYATTFALVVVVVMGMSTYFKRLLQARYVGARDYAGDQVDAVFNDPTLNLAGRFSRQYEPYYQQTAVDRLMDQRIVEQDQGGVGKASIYSKEYQQYESVSRSVSNQLSPRFAD